MKLDPDIRVFKIIFDREGEVCNILSLPPIFETLMFKKVCAK